MDSSWQLENDICMKTQTNVGMEQYTIIYGMTYIANNDIISCQYSQGSKQINENVEFSIKTFKNVL